ncbi:MAG: HD domain-containing protein [Desulfobacter sp.]|nr:HD domain-containing protein [Desulfobacter sp.]WDP84878.1 MAG: HD domain-containing protein [Desulfobacter sp.]
MADSSPNIRAGKKRFPVKSAALAPSAKAHILIVDDDPSIQDLFERAMEVAGHRCTVAPSGQIALEIMGQTPVDILITGHAQGYQYDEIINIGASDFVEKPFSIQEIILRVRRVLKERQLKKAAQNAHEELKHAYVDSIHRLVMASEFKDEDTGDHIVRIGEYASCMARLLGLDTRFIETIGYAAPMHDVGKIGIPDSILLKPGKLTPKEFEIIKQHPLIGARLLSKSKSKILQMAEEIALTHHEKFNGKGYPKGLSKQEIPLSGRIVAIADTFDALTSKRPYKKPYPPEMVFDIIRQEKANHFDPMLTDLFLEHFDHFLSIRQALGDISKITLEEFNLSERDEKSIRT